MEDSGSSDERQVDKKGHKQKINRRDIWYILQFIKIETMGEVLLSLSEYKLKYLNF
jgi:hypothetical protein